MYDKSDCSDNNVPLTSMVMLMHMEVIVMLMNEYFVILLFFMMMFFLVRFLVVMFRTIPLCQLRMLQPYNLTSTTHPFLKRARRVDFASGDLGRTEQRLLQIMKLYSLNKSPYMVFCN